VGAGPETSPRVAIYIARIVKGENLATRRSSRHKSGTLHHPQGRQGAGYPASFVGGADEPI
jgi:hypothetical protein